MPCRFKLRSALVKPLDGLHKEPRPHGCKKLVGHKDLWRIRIGSYRVIYFIGDAVKLVRIEKVSDRKDAYR
jgi:mRNA interferase RelE/StbE